MPVAERIAYETITAVPDQWGTHNSGATLGSPATFNLDLIDGDAVFLIANSGLTSGNAATTVVPVVAGPGQQNWQNLGQLQLARNPYLFVLINAQTASGPVTVTWPENNYVVALAQVYRGVGRAVPVPFQQAGANTRPAIAPSATTHFDVTVPGSMGVAGFSWANGGNNGLAFPDARCSNVQSSQAVAIKDQIFSTAAQHQLEMDWTNTSGVLNHYRLCVLFEPRERPAGITAVAGGGGACGNYATFTGAANCQIPLTVQAGDVLVAGSSGRLDPVFSSLCGASFVRYGPSPSSQSFAFSVANLPACTGHIQVNSGSATGSYCAIVQAYRGAEFDSLTMAPGASSTNGSGLVTSSWGVTVRVPGTCVVTGWFLSATGGATVQTPTRQDFDIATGTHCICDHIVNDVGLYRPQIEFIGTAYHVRWIAVLEPKEEVGPPPAPTATLSAYPLTIDRGQASTLTWHTTHAQSVTISGLGAVQLSGSQSVTPSSTTTYQLTATGEGGTHTTSVTVTVIQPPAPPLGDLARLATGLLLLRIPVKIPLED